MDAATLTTVAGSLTTFDWGIALEIAAAVAAAAGLPWYVPLGLRLIRWARLKRDIKIEVEPPPKFPNSNDCG